MDEILVYDHREPCPYLPNLTARMPLRQPLAPLSGAELDQRLAAGDRRSGPFLYRTQCPTCSACEPLRLDVERFAPSRGQRRAFRRGERLLQTHVTQPLVDDEHLRLFNLHRRGRGLARRQADCGWDEYNAFLIETCCESLELQYRFGDQLVAVAIADRGQSSLSAVYCYFDPAAAHLSPGVYSILKQVELARLWGMRYVYLGLYVAASRHMSYKSGYLPHQRLVNGRWREYQG